jgi:hypothetical protein
LPLCDLPVNAARHAGSEGTRQAACRFSTTGNVHKRKCSGTVRAGQGGHDQLGQEPDFQKTFPRHDDDETLVHSLSVGYYGKN